MCLASGSDPPNNVNKIENKKQKLDSSYENVSGDEDETSTCIICSEVWTSRGDHCLVSLPCGHLFGKKCIVRWILDKSRKSNSKKAGCPMCMKTTRETDIRVVKPSKIAVKDTSQMDLLKKELEALKNKIKENKNALDLARLSLNLHKKELERARERHIIQLPQIKETMIIKNPLRSLNVNTSYLSPSSSQNNIKLQPTFSNVSHEDKENYNKIPDNFINKMDHTNIPYIKNSYRYSICKSKRLSENRHVARVMALDQQSNTAYISFKSSKDGHGILKLNLTNVETTEFISTHNGLVRDIQYNSEKPNLILSTGIDKSLQLISTITNTVEKSVMLPTAGWSCSFDSLDSNKLHCGLIDSTILTYDIRNLSVPFNQFKSSTISKTPLHSMFSKKILDRRVLCCSNLNQAFIWDYHEEIPICNLLSIENGYKPFSFSFNYGSESSLLLSSRNNIATKHQLLKLNEDYSTTVIATLDFQLPQKNLTRTCSYVMHPDIMDNQESVICYSNEVEGMLCLSKSNQDKLQHFRINSCPLDIQIYDQLRLAFLTDNRFFLLQLNK
ncbi:uncharacterized protein BX663DRAFT_524057 [Cokeromyces recurvatus]|uniref:uncharacterized protein n=1 Tax=Cokeromyces recurvatus TaxID=90255 RepID=UPI0022207F10|nr:uncharacterized protein BX663DRAFT_524057 [Cokeromyces recurvatus]KAI7898603.1 hypothetical protein BX663DRAFT_524057 [Cokeromyces recurvatus]